MTKSQVINRRYDATKHILKTQVDEPNLVLGAFGCAGCGNDKQRQVAQGIQANQSKISMMKYLGDMEYPDDGVSLNEKTADSQFKRYVTEFYKYDDLPYYLLIGNHEVGCHNSGPIDINEALNKAEACKKTTQRSYSDLSGGRLSDGQAKFSMPNCYYLEEVYYVNQSGESKPLALILHLDSSLLPGDEQQQNWLKTISAKLNSDHYKRFPQRVLAQHHTVFFSPDKRGRKKQEHPKYPHNKAYTGNHHRVVGCVLQECGIQLDQWILCAAHQHNTTISENYGSSNLPIIQAVFGGGGSPDNKKDYKTMIPGLQYTYSGYGYGAIEIQIDGSFSISYYDCSDKHDLNRCRFHRRYKADGTPEKQYAKSAYLHKKLLEKTDKTNQIVDLLVEMVKNADDINWRLLPWFIIAYTDWVPDVESNNISPQVFEELLKVSKRSLARGFETDLSAELLADTLKGIEHCFNHYMDPRYRGFYSSMFCQLAVWHQALSEMYRVIQYSEFNDSQSSTSSAATSTYSHNTAGTSIESTSSVAMANYLERWVNGYRAQSDCIDEEQGNNSLDNQDDQEADYSTEVLEQSRPSNVNSFDTPDKMSTLAYNDSIDTSDELALEEYVNNKQLFTDYLKHACDEVLSLCFGIYSDWSRFFIAMHHHNAFAQTQLTLAFLGLRNPGQVLSGLFYYHKQSWLSNMLEAQLIYMFWEDQKDPSSANRIFKSSLDHLLFGLESEEAQGQVLQDLAKKHHPYLGLLLNNSSCFSLTRHPLIREQMYCYAQRTKLAWHEMYINYLKAIEDRDNMFLRRLFDCFIDSSGIIDTKTVFQYFYDRLNDLMQNDEHQQSSDKVTQYFNELELKQSIDRFKQNHQFRGDENNWHKLLRSFTEWLFVNFDTQTTQNKWYLIQNNWPKEWQQPSQVFPRHSSLNEEEGNAIRREISMTEQP